MKHFARFLQFLIVISTMLAVNSQKASAQSSCIYDIMAEAHACDSNGHFLVDLNFQHMNTSDSFYVVGNGMNYGTFSYDDLFLTLGPLSGDAQTTWEFIAQ